MITGHHGEGDLLDHFGIQIALLEGVTNPEKMSCPKEGFSMKVIIDIVGSDVVRGPCHSSRKILHERLRVAGSDKE